MGFFNFNISEFVKLFLILCETWISLLCITGVTYIQTFIHCLFNYWIELLKPWTTCDIVSDNKMISIKSGNLRVVFKVLSRWQVMQPDGISLRVLKTAKQLDPLCADIFKSSLTWGFSLFQTEYCNYCQTVVTSVLFWQHRSNVAASYWTNKSMTPLLQPCKQPLSCSYIYWDVCTDLLSTAPPSTLQICQNWF